MLKIEVVPRYRAEEAQMQENREDEKDLRRVSGGALQEQQYILLIMQR